MKNKYLVSALLFLGIGVAIGSSLYVSAEENDNPVGNMITNIVMRLKGESKVFEYAEELNDGDTSFVSEPVEGKKTGEMLTAAEFNRVLEMLQEGGVGGWEDIALTDVNHFDKTCEYRVNTDASGDSNAGYQYPVWVVAQSIGFDVSTAQFAFGVVDYDDKSKMYYSEDGDIADVDGNRCSEIVCANWPVNRIQKRCQANGGTSVPEGLPDCVEGEALVKGADGWECGAGGGVGGCGDRFLGVSTGYRRTGEASVQLPIPPGADYAFLSIKGNTFYSGDAHPDQEDNESMEVFVDFSRNTSSGIHGLQVGGDNIHVVQYHWNNQPLGADVALIAGDTTMSSVGWGAVLKPNFTVNGSFLEISHLSGNSSRPWQQSFIGKFYDQPSDCS